MNLSPYTRCEIQLFGFALCLTVMLLILGFSPSIAAVPTFLAWLVVNRGSD